MDDKQIEKAQKRINKLLSSAAEIRQEVDLMMEEARGREDEAYTLQGDIDRELEQRIVNRRIANS